MAEKQFDTELPLIRGSNTTSRISTFGVADSISTATPFYPDFPRPPKTISAKDITANIVADLILDFCQEHGDLVTNLRLQRLLYFAQGWHLGLHGKPLFREPLQAWASGPVQPEVYARFLPFGAAPIVVSRLQWHPPKQIADFIAELMEVYGRFSSFDLQRIACDEEPWREARKGLAHDEPSNSVIDTATMKRVYRGKSKQGQS